MEQGIGWQMEHFFEKWSATCHCGMKTKHRIKHGRMKVVVCTNCIPLIRFKVYGDEETLVFVYEESELSLY